MDRARKTSGTSLSPGDRIACAQARAHVVPGLCLVLTLVTTAIAQEGRVDEGAHASSVGEMSGAFKEAFVFDAGRGHRIDSMTDALDDLPPFFGETRLGLRSRTYAFQNESAGALGAHTFTTGGSFSLVTGWIANKVQLGATVFTTQKLDADDEDSLLDQLATGEEGITILGEAYAHLLVHDDLHGIIGRKMLDFPFLDKDDSRMIPNTFETYALFQKIKKVNLTLGYVRTMKERTENQFESMAEVAGATGSDNGLVLGGGDIEFSDSFGIGGVNLFIRDVINTFLAEVHYVREFDSGIGIRLEAQAMDQRSVGEDLLGRGGFDTRLGTAQGTVSYAGATLSGAISVADPEASIIRPWGSFPGYLSMMRHDFAYADEKAWLIGGSYNLERLGFDGVSLFARWGNSWDGVSPDTGLILDRTEVDVTLDVRPDFGVFDGFWFRLRYAYFDPRGGQIESQWRAILNFDF